MVVAFMIMLIMVVDLAVNMRMVVMALLCTVPCGTDCFGSSVHDELSDYFKYLLMTSISSSPAAARLSFPEPDCKRCKRTCPSRISAINAFMAPRQAASVSSTSPQSRSSFKAFSMPLICPRMRLILDSNFFLFWITCAMGCSDNIPGYGIAQSRHFRVDWQCDDR